MTGLTAAEHWLIACYVLLAGLLCVNPPYPEQLPLQHIPTLLALGALVLVQRRYRLASTSFVLVLVFLLLHAVGARYIYSYVPYDAWSTTVLGSSISSIFGFHRNHYDRLIHFAYGLLFAYVARDAAIKAVRLRATLASYAALEWIMATSLLYELFEWLVALLLSPSDAEAYNGQQGDWWDAQKDMALATLGAVCTLVMLWGRGRWPAHRAGVGVPSGTRRIVDSHGTS